jgi:hypothetical protein
MTSLKSCSNTDLSVETDHFIPLDHPPICETCKKSEILRVVELVACTQVSHPNLTMLPWHLKLINHVVVTQYYIPSHPSLYFLFFSHKVF